MAKLEDVIRQLQSQLPKYTDSFNDVNAVTGASVTGGVMTINLENENYQDSLVNIKDLFAQLDVVGVSGTDTADYYNIETEFDHDQTYSDIEKQFITKTVDFIGDFSGEYELKDVPANNIITIESDSVPPSGGSFSLLESRGYSGRKSVTWDDSQTLNYDVQFDIDPYVAAASGTYVQSNIRIDGIGSEQDIARYLENETLILEKNTLFVLMGGPRVSKSRETFSDAYNRKEYKDDLHIEVVQEFSLFAIIPTQDDVTPRDAINSIHDLRTYLVKSLHGATFDSGFESVDKFLCTYLGDDGEQYNRSYYVHRFDFETVFNIEDVDALQIEDTRAFREFDIGLKMQFDDYEDVKKTISGTIGE